MDSIKFNFRGIIFQSLQSKWAVLWCCISSLILTCGLYFLAAKTLLEISFKIATEISSTLPNILGFTLGGYALIIGLGNEKLLQLICDIPKGKKTSLYQQLNASFALTLIVQIITLLFGISYKLIFDTTNFKNVLQFYSIHHVLTFVLCFLSFWSLLSLIDLAVKVFNIGQLQFLHLKK